MTDAHARLPSSSSAPAPGCAPEPIALAGPSEDRPPAGRELRWAFDRRVDVLALCAGGLFALVAVLRCMSGAIPWGGIDRPVVSPGDLGPTERCCIALLAAFVVTPHLAATYLVWLGNESLWERGNRIRKWFLGSHLAFVGGAMPLIFWATRYPIGLAALFAIQIVFELQHYTAQDRGLTAIYRHRGAKGGRSSKDDAYFHYLLFWALLNSFFSRDVPLSAEVPGATIFAGSLPSWLFSLSHAALAVATVDLVVRHLREEGAPSLPKIFFVLTVLTCFSMTVTAPSIGFFVVRFHHGASYMGISFVLMRNLSRANRFSVRGRLVRAGLQSGWMYLLSMALVALPITVLNAFGGDASGPPNAVAMTNAIYFHHYMLEALIWRFRNPEIRRAVGTYLQPA